MPEKKILDLKRKPSKRNTSFSRFNVTKSQLERAEMEVDNQKFL